MAKTGDILLNNDGSIKIIDGDLSFGDATNDNIMALLNTSPGEWKQSPVTGVGIENYMLKLDFNEMIREIKGQLQDDGMDNASVKLIDGQIKISGDYAS